MNIEQLSPMIFLKKAARWVPNDIAMKSGQFKLSYAQFYDQTLRLSVYMKNYNVTCGDRVCILAKNCPETLLAHYAIPLSGAIIVPINTVFDERIVLFILAETSAKILICDRLLWLDSYALTGIKFIFTEDIFDVTSNVEGETLQNYKTIKLETIDNLRELDIISINYTSGSTGKPKGVMITHRGAYLNALGECIHASLNNSSRFLWTLPIFHCNGWGFSWAVTAVVAMHVFVSSIDAELIIDTILSERITHLCAAPTLLKKIQQSSKFNKLKKAGILRVFTAGAFPNIDLISAFEDLCVEVIHVYGLTETHGPHLISMPLSEWDHNTSSRQKANHKTAQGIPAVHSGDVRVVDCSGVDVPHDGKTLGEVIMKGNNVMAGYYRRPQETEEVFLNGWFYSGDAAVILSDNYIEIKDRFKDIINSGGEKIPSLLVENALESFPGVVMAAVIPEAHPYWGEIVHAFIEFKDGEDTSVTEEAIKDHCRKLLPKIMIPKKITISIIPITNTGKKQKHLLISADRNKKTAW